VNNAIAFGNKYVIQIFVSKIIPDENTTFLSKFVNGTNGRNGLNRQIKNILTYTLINKSIQYKYLGAHAKIPNAAKK
jgi:hypothetical protein